MIDYRGKTALVTGAGRRLGRHVALSLAAQGLNIIAHFRTSEGDATEAAELAQKKGVQAWPVRADFSDADDLKRFTKECSKIAVR